MNAIVSIDVATLTPATVFAPGGVEAIISKIEAEVSAEVFTLETPEGRERIKSVAYRVARSKTALDEMGKELVADIKAKAGAIDAERRTIRDRLDALKDSVRGPLTAWETREAERISSHEQALCLIMEARWFADPSTAEMIRERLADVDGLAALDWEEFKERADSAIADARAILGPMLAAAVQAEADVAELAELRRLKAEREAEDIARRNAEARAEAKAKAEEHTAEINRRHVEQAAAAAKAAAEQAAAEAIAAAARAVEQERERVARVKADEERAAAKREANAKHRAKIIGKAEGALMDRAIEQQAASRIIEAIVRGEIPHVTISF